MDVAKLPHIVVWLHFGRRENRTKVDVEEVGKDVRREPSVRNGIQTIAAIRKKSTNSHVGGFAGAGVR